MDASTVAVIIGAFAALFIVVVSIIGANISEANRQAKYTRNALRDLAHSVGFEVETHYGGRLRISLPWDTSSIPATRGDVERFFAEHEAKEKVVNKHFGIKVEERYTPPVAAKTELVVVKDKNK